MCFHRQKSVSGNPKLLDWLLQQFLHTLWRVLLNGQDLGNEQVEEEQWTSGQEPRPVGIFAAECERFKTKVARKSSFSIFRENRTRSRVEQLACCKFYLHALLLVFHLELSSTTERFPILRIGFLFLFD